MILFQSPYAKAITAFIVAVIGGGIAQGLINGTAAAWLTIVIGALTAGGVFAAKNLPRSARGDAGAVTLSVVLLIVAVFLLVLAAVLFFGAFGTHSDMPTALGWGFLGLAAFAAAHLPI